MGLRELILFPGVVRCVNKKRLIVGILFALVVADAAIFVGIGTETAVTHWSNGEHGSFTRASQPIRINSDTDFSQFSGQGTQTNPYKIENLVIDAQNKGPGIYIGNTTAYFIIENCTIYNDTASSGTYYEAAGIELYNVQNGAVYNCTTHHVNYGVYLTQSHKTRVENSTFYEFGKYGIYYDLSSSTDIVASNNTINGTGEQSTYGIYLNGGSGYVNATVENNTINNTDYGVYVSYTQNITVNYNRFSNMTDYGIYIYQGTANITIEHNILSDLTLKEYSDVNHASYIYLEETKTYNISYNKITDGSPFGSRGIYLISTFYGKVYGNTLTNASIKMSEEYRPGPPSIKYLDSVSMSNNILNGKPVLFRNGGDLGNIPIDTASYSELILINVSNAIINSGNFSHYGEAIILYYDTNVSITGASFYQLINAVVAHYSSNLTINNTVMNGIENKAVYLDTVEHYLIENSTITMTGSTRYMEMALDIENSYKSGNYSKIDNNTISGFSIMGIFLADCGNVSVYNNTIYFNGVKSPYSFFQSYFSAIYVDTNEEQMSVENNTIHDVGHGIYTHMTGWYAPDPIIANNTIYNTTYAMLSHGDTSGSDNVIYRNNTLINNTYGVLLNNTYTDMYGNEIINSSYAVYLEYAGVLNKIINTTMVNGGIYIRHKIPDDLGCGINTINNTTVNGKPVHFFLGKSHITVDGKNYGEILVGASNNITIENFTAKNTTVGIEAIHVQNLTVLNASLSDNVIAGVDFYLANYSSVLSSTFNSSKIGIAIDLSKNDTVSGVNTTGNEVGVYLNRTHNSAVKYGNMNENRYGVYLNNSNNDTVTGVNTTSNIIGLYLNNSVYNSIYSMKMTGDGIFMNGSAETFSTQDIPYNTNINTVNGKTVYYLKNEDLYGTSVPSDAGEVIAVNVQNLKMSSGSLSKGTVGMLLYNVQIATVTGVSMNNNTLFGLYAIKSSELDIENSSFQNDYTGIYFNAVSTSKVVSNLISNSSSYGVYLTRSSGNLLWNNTFFHNNGSNATYNSSHIQAYDSGTDNWWNTTGSPGKGNYWSDWTSPDSDGNHIVDEPYRIAGGSGAKDYYPLTEAPIPVPEFGWGIFGVLVTIALVVLRRRARA